MGSRSGGASRKPRLTGGVVDNPGYYATFPSRVTATVVRQLPDDSLDELEGRLRGEYTREGRDVQHEYNAFGRGEEADRDIIREGEQAMRYIDAALDRVRAERARR